MDVFSYFSLVPRIEAKATVISQESSTTNAVREAISFPRLAVVSVTSRKDYLLYFSKNHIQIKSRRSAKDRFRSN